VKKAVCASLPVARYGWKELIRRRGWKEINMAEIEKEPTPMTPSDAGRKGGGTVPDRYEKD